MLEPNTWLRQYGEGYCHLEKRERRAIFDFVMLWSLFEAQVHNNNASAEGCLTAVDWWHVAGLLDDAPLEECWQHFLGRLRKGEDVSHHFDGLRIRNPSHRELVKSAILAREADCVTKLKALMVVIHRMRNNLLHGEKWSYGLADQEQNFRAASHALMISMDMHRQLPRETNQWRQTRLISRPRSSRSTEEVIIKTNSKIL